MVRYFFTLNGILAIAILLAILIFLGATGLTAFFEISPTEFFLNSVWRPEPYSGPPQWGMLSFAVGTFYVAAIALSISVPFGISTAIYMAKIAAPRIRELMKPVIEMIAGLPSVVLGVFGILFLGPFLHDSFGLEIFSALNAGILVGFMAIPTIASISEDVLTSVPKGFEDASMALGATRWQTIRHVTLPAAASGVAASVMLGLGRVVGETMVVLMVAGNVYAMPKSFLDPVIPLTSVIAIEIKEVVVGGLYYRALFALALTLFIITFVINLIAEVMIHKEVERYT